MWLIVGLGNPGDEYAATRHNVGFRVVDEVTRRCGLSFTRTKFRASAASGQSAGQRFSVLKPNTFMNDSGWAVRRAADFFQVEPGRILVVYDDLDLALGRVRLREGGGSGGHNGVRSIIAHLHTEGFPRLRLGIGRPERLGGGADHVLSAFRPDERGTIDEAISRAADAVEYVLAEGFTAAMNRFNA